MVYTQFKPLQFIISLELVASYVDMFILIWTSWPEIFVPKLGMLKAIHSTQNLVFTCSSLDSCRYNFVR